MRRNKPAWIIIGAAILILALVIVLTPKGKDMNADPGTLTNVPTADRQ